VNNKNIIKSVISVFLNIENRNEIKTKIFQNYDSKKESKEVIKGVFELNLEFHFDNIRRI